MSTFGENEVPAAPRTGILARVPEGFNTRKMTADKIGRSLSTIKVWEDAGIIEPDDHFYAGRLRVNLYSDRYIRDTIEPLLEKIISGPTRLEGKGAIEDRVYLTKR